MKNKFLTLLCTLTAATALIACAVRCVLTLTLLDADYGVYTQDTVLPTVFHIALALALAALACIGFIAAKDNPRPINQSANIFTVFSASLAGFLLSAQMILSLYYMIVSGTPLGILAIIKLVAAIPTIIFFFTFLKSGVAEKPLTLLSLFVPVYLMLVLIERYFDMSILNTSPGRILAQLALLGATIFLLTEPRILLGRSNGRLYLMSAPIAVVLVATSSLPNLIFPGKLLLGDSDTFLGYAFELAVGLFILSRLIAFVRSPENAPEPIVEEAVDDSPEPSETQE